MKDDFFEELESRSPNNLPKETYKNVKNETENNINYFLKLATSIRILFIVLSIVLFFVGIMSSYGNMVAFIICLICSVILIISAILITPFFEWKAYVLKNLYEINKKK